MNLEQAMNIIENVCAKALGTLADHKAIQEALEIIKTALKKD